jgi:hypothetical protein
MVCACMEVDLSHLCLYGRLCLHSSAAVARKEMSRKHSLHSAMSARMVVRDRLRCCVLCMLVMLLSDLCSFVMLGDYSVTVTVNF